MSNGIKNEMRKPVVFIASSSEGKDVAEAIAQNLHEVCECRIWSNGVFESGRFYLETLLENSPEYDFAVMTLTDDDTIIVRGNEYNSPRDNVLFELGMYIGRLGRDRTFIISDKSANLKLPSDLAGLTTGSFDPPTQTTYRDAVSYACIDIKNAIKKLGPKKTQTEADKNCFPKDVKIIEDVGSVLQNQVLPIIRKIASAGGNIAIKNFGLDLENVMIWLKDRINKGEFTGVAVSFKCLIINPESSYLKELIDNTSNISSDSINSSIRSAKRIADNSELRNFELEMRQYDLPPIAHGFVINDTHVFLGFTEIKNGKLIGGIKPYIYLDKQQCDTSPIAVHYFTFFNSWFDCYWNISKPVAHVKK